MGPWRMPHHMARTRPAMTHGQHATMRDGKAALASHVTSHWSYDNFHMVGHMKMWRLVLSEKSHTLGYTDLALPTSNCRNIALPGCSICTELFRSWGSIPNASHSRTLDGIRVSEYPCLQMQNLAESTKRRFAWVRTFVEWCGPYCSRSEEHEQALDSPQTTDSEQTWVGGVWCAIRRRQFNGPLLAEFRPSHFRNCLQPWTVIITYVSSISRPQLAWRRFSRLGSGVQA